MSGTFFPSHRRWSRITVLCVTALLILFAFPFNRSLVNTLWTYGRYPPLYPEHRELQLNLSHYASYAHSDVKYIWSPNHPILVGWGNIMQDYLLSYVLAHATNRSFVFDDYTWQADGRPYSAHNGELVPSRIPLNAMIDGPLVGGELPAGDTTPRAVYKDFFYKVCPNPTILRLNDVHEWNDGDTVKFVIDKWVEKIKSIEDPCLQFEELSPDKQIFNVLVYGEKDRLLSIWPYMSSLPALTQWGWSPLIHDAFATNQKVIYPPAESWSPDGDSRVNQMMTGLVVIHVRRGDFDRHCQFLASWNADWNAFNSFPELPDKYDRAHSDPRESPENRQAYMDHCFPGIEYMVEKVAKVREETRAPLDYLYIMTNGDNAFVAELQAAMERLGGWKHMASNLDLNLTWEQRFIAQAVDMLVAQRAHVFIGNGWSSLTSNVVMLRYLDEIPPENNRFW